MNWADLKIAEKVGLVVDKERVDRIQTTTKKTLSTAGWYRVAEYDSLNQSAAVIGGMSNGVQLIIRRGRSSNDNEEHILRLLSVLRNQTFVSVCSKSVVQLITKVRYVRDTTKLIAYLEVYYSGTGSNSCRFTVSDVEDARSAWKIITPTLTEETVDGVTVSTTYDIPANASPVTDFGSFISPYFKSGETILSWSSNPNGVYKKFVLSYGNIPSDIPVNTEGWCEVKIDEETNRRKVFFYQYGTTDVYEREIWQGAWRTNWTKSHANVADLANYLPNTGGTITASDLPTIRFNSVSKPNTYGQILKYGDGMRVGLYGSDGSFSNELVLGNDVTDEHTMLRLLLNNSEFREILHTGNIYGLINKDIITWNQLTKGADMGTGSYYNHSFSNGVHTISLTNPSVTWARICIAEGVTDGHKVYIRLTGDNAVISSATYTTENADMSDIVTLTEMGGTRGGIVTNSKARVTVQFQPYWATHSELKVTVNVFDLTLMFGAGKEPTAEEFDRMFPEDFYEYDAGTVLTTTSVKLKECFDKHYMHKGNSAAVKIQSSAPTDTSALWIW